MRRTRKIALALLLLIFLSPCAQAEPATLETPRHARAASPQVADLPQRLKKIG